jgi:hypothetical protein
MVILYASSWNQPLLPAESIQTVLVLHSITVNHPKCRRDFLLSPPYSGLIELLRGD